MRDARLLARLFLAFSRVGAFTFGGGYAMLPMLEREVVDRRGWVSHADLLDMFGIAQAAPGVIAVNMATFTGRRVAGFWGSVAAVLGVAWPSVLVICAVALCFDRFRELKWVAHAFEGVRAGVLALIAAALRKLGRGLRPSAFNLATGCAAFAATAFFNAGAAWVILAAVAAGLLADVAGRKKNGAGNG